MAQVAGAQGVSWDVVLGKSALEFLNTMAYVRDRAEWQKEEMEKWKRMH